MDTPIAQIATQTNQNDAPQLPHNIEAEQGLLGALLINNDAMEQISDFLLARHFFDPVHARIFEAISKLVNNGNLASPVTLKTYLDDQPGIVAKVATWIHQRGGNVLHADQHLDRQENVFFQRVEWEPDADRNPREESDEFISFVERELTRFFHYFKNFLGCSSGHNSRTYRVY